MEPLRLDLEHWTQEPRQKALFVKKKYKTTKKRRERNFVRSFFPSLKRAPGLQGKILVIFFGFIELAVYWIHDKTKW